VNRHSALLPAYGGLWPVFQAYRCNEQHVGVSVHVMGEKIDRGLVLAQHRIPVEETDTLFDLYRKCFAASSDVLLQALDKVRERNLTQCETDQAQSYFSFPTKEHWAEFRARGGRFI
jgi:methionyl-tRNA formyltransferase